jgi:CBS domain-containing protein
MRIHDIMSTPVVVCDLNDSLNGAARLMWEHDCGVVPVVKEDGRIAGILTDRDVSMAAYTQGKPLFDIAVGQAMAKRVFSCREDDSLESAARIMTDNHVRRLPVLDGHDRPVGLVSFSDIVRVASETLHGHEADHEVLRELAVITQPRLVPERPAVNPPAPRRHSPVPTSPRSRGPH